MVCLMESWSNLKHGEDKEVQAAGGFIKRYLAHHRDINKVNQPLSTRRELNLESEKLRAAW